MMEDDPPCDLLPAAIAELVRSGRLQAAEQKLLKRLPSADDITRVAMALRMASAWFNVSDLGRTRRWLGRMPSTANAVQALSAAHLAHGADDPTLAFQWFELARHARAPLPLDEHDRLQHGQCALAAAERARIPHGRQGSWQRHLLLLARAEQLLGELASSANDAAIVERAVAGRERASRLLGSRSARCDVG